MAGRFERRSNAEPMNPLEPVTSTSMTLLSSTVEANRRTCQQLGP